MPISVARKIEFHQRDPNKPEYHDLDVRLEPIILMAEQVDEYDLPRIPVKDTDRRKDRFEAANGEGQVELDVLEAVRPGELARIVTEAILQYRDLELPERVQEACEKYESYLEGETDEIRSAYTDRQEAAEAEYETLREEWQAIREEYAAHIEPFRPRIEALRGRFEANRARVGEIHGDVLRQCRLQIGELDSFDRPEAELLEEPDGQLYDSRRNYFEQLETYWQHKAGEERG